MPDNYSLRRGLQGAERLRLLARVKRVGTMAFLKRAGLKRGMRCVDVGCGIGEVTMDLARLCAPGQCLGVELDSNFLTVAQASVKRRRVSNVALLQADAYHLPLDGPVDFAFARFLLTHLQSPLRALREMVRWVRSGGVVAVEDIDFGGQFTYPRCDAVERYQEVYQSLVRHRGGDACIGPRLPALLREAGLAEVRLQVEMPVFAQGEGKSVARVTLENIAEAAKDAGLIDDAEVTLLLKEMERFERDPATLVSMPRIFQVWGTVC